MSVSEPRIPERRRMARIEFCIKMWIQKHGVPAFMFDSTAQGEQ